MILRGARGWSVATGLLLAALLAGCPRKPDPAPNAVAVVHSAGVGHAAKPAPPKSGPLPPRRLFEAEQVDRRCRADADCVIKDLGSCCGAFPSCVNRNSPADPAAVKAACKKNGQAADCSRRVPEQCACRQGQCMAAGETPVGGWVDDAPTTPDRSR